MGLSRSTPCFFASLKVEITLSFEDSVTTATVASIPVVGNMLMIASASFNVLLVFPGLMILVFICVSLYAVLSLVEWRMTGQALGKKL
ncbi:MAG: hypothetical protein AAGI03_01725 [Pseudomonadota bacterium]